MLFFPVFLGLTLLIIIIIFKNNIFVSDFFSHVGSPKKSATKELTQRILGGVDLGQAQRWRGSCEIDGSLPWRIAN